MGGKFVFNKKTIMFSILLVFLLVSAVSAADNATDDIASVDDENSVLEIFDGNETSLESSQDDSIVDSAYEEDEYENVYVESLNGYYGGKNTIKYGWTGNLNGYFEIYKGSSLVYEKQLSSDGNINHDESYQGSAIKNAGTYRAQITDDYGYVLAKATIKINKAATHVVAYSFSSKIGSKEYLLAGISDTKEKNLYETSGKVKFNFAGKTYTIKLKKGRAYKLIKMPLKAKTYKGTVKFLGNSNYKASSGKFKVKLSSSKVTLLNKNKSIKVGKYTVKLTSNQYRSLVKSFNKDKSKNLKVKTANKYKVKIAYSKPVRTYKTTKAVKTWYAASYMPMINKMKSNGWTKVSEYTYNEPNPQNKYGIGLSSYTIAVCKWVKVSYKTAYKTKEYPVYAHISYKKGTTLPIIKVYSHGKTLNSKYLAIA